MRRHHSYSYPFPQPSMGRSSSVHHSNGVQSASMNPDEDWTKISDLAERRRIQNRIAQRNYRKKLKRRLEDLERRAGSNSPPPDQQSTPTAARNQRPDDGARKKKGARQEVTSPAASSRAPLPMASSFSPREDPSNMFARQHTRQLSASPPPSFTYSFPAAEPSPQHAPFQTLPYPEYPNHAFYLPPLPPARPGLGSFDPAPPKAESNFAEEDLAGHFNMDYPNAATGAEVGPSHPSTSSNAALNVWLPKSSLQPLNSPVIFH